MKFSELSNKDRYRIIRMGVQNGIHSVSDIEHIFDEGGHLYDGNSTLSQQLMPKKLTDYNQGDWSAIYDKQQAANNARLAAAQAEWDKMHDEVVNNPDAYDPVDIYKYIGKRPEAIQDVNRNERFENDAKVANAIGVATVATPYVAAYAPQVLTNQMVQPIAKSMMAGMGADAVSELATGKPVAEHTKDAIQFATGLNPRNNAVSNFVFDTFGNPFYGFTSESAQMWNSAINNGKKIVNKTIQSVRNKVNPLGELVVPENFIKVEPKVRYKLGDVEVNNPNLFYRQGENLAKDLIESGVVRTKPQPAQKIGKINLTKNFENPMFNKGHRFYGNWNEGDLLVTSAENKMKNIKPGTTKSDAVYIPNKESDLNINNTTAYTYEPGYGYRKVTNQPEVKTISFEEATNISSKIDKMNKAYEQAFKTGDYETGQRMWDKWFLEQSKKQGYKPITNKSGNIEEMYHTVSPEHDPSFNSFDTQIEGTPTAVYTTNKRVMSESYANGHLPPTKEVREQEIEALKNNLKEVYTERINAINTQINYLENEIKVLNSQNEISNEIKNKSKIIEIDKNEIQKRKQQLEEVNGYITNVNKIAEQKWDIENAYRYKEKNRVKELRGVMKKPLTINGKGANWSWIETRKYPKEQREFVYNKNIQGFKEKEKINNIDEFEKRYKTNKEFRKDIDYLIDYYNKHAAGNDPNYKHGFMSTREIEEGIRTKGVNDGAIIKNIKDYGSLHGLNKKDITPGNVYEFMNPEQIKYTAPFTLDNNGNLIPLSQRGNFNINDLRYSLLPITGIGIGAKLISNNE